MEYIRLPTVLVEELNHVKSDVSSDIYNILLRFLIDLDNQDLLNDQIAISEAYGGLSCDWTYGIYFDINYSESGLPSYNLYVPRRNISYTNTADYDTCRALLFSILTDMVNKDDIYDAYRRDKRTELNTEIVYIGGLYEYTN